MLLYSLLIDEENDKEKFEIIYKLYSKKMWYAANAILSDSFLAEDAVHNAFIGIAKNIDKIADPNSTRTLSYVITAAKNGAIDILRKTKGNNETDIDELFYVSDNSSAFYKTIETEDSIKKAIASIPSVYRDVLYLLTVEQMTEKEIAQLLNRKPSTVHQQVRRGRLLLKEILKKGE